MNIDEFYNQVKQCKGYTQGTGGFNLKVRTNAERTYFEISDETKCNRCNHIHHKGIEIQFKTKVSLTVFQAGMLYAIFILKKKPHDYAQYHECVAGKKFIENIKSIKVSK